MTKPVATIRTSLQNFFLGVDLSNSYVVTGLPLIFLCGGSINDGSSGTQSLRKALVKTQIFQDTSKVKIFIAEKVLNFETTKHKDLKRFEKLIGNYCDIVVVILESPGSICELGVFSEIVEISEKLLVIIEGCHFEKSSFIRQGVLQALGENVKPISWQTVTGDNMLFTLEPDDLADIADQIISKASQLTTSRKKLSLDKTRHQVAFVYSCCRLLIGPTKSEIEECLEIFQNIAGLPPEPSFSVQEILEMMQVFEMITVNYYRGKKHHFLSDPTESVISSRVPWPHVQFNWHSGTKNYDQRKLDVFSDLKDSSEGKWRIKTSPHFGTKP